MTRMHFKNPRLGTWYRFRLWLHCAISLHRQASVYDGHNMARWCSDCAEDNHLWDALRRTGHD
jgi:hypothetical protein